MGARVDETPLSDKIIIFAPFETSLSIFVTISSKEISIPLKPISTS